APNGGRSDELLDLLDTVPAAEVVAQSIGEYDNQHQEKQRAAAVAAAPVQRQPSKVVAARPLELQPAPAAAGSPGLIREAEFQKLTGGAGEDPIGEWEWAVAAAGPVTVQIYEEN